MAFFRKLSGLLLLGLFLLLGGGNSLFEPLESAFSQDSLFIQYAPEITFAETLQFFPADGILTFHAQNIGTEETDHIVFLDDQMLQVSEIRGSEVDVFITSTLNSGNLTITYNGLTSAPYPVTFPTPEVTSIEFPNGKDFEAEFWIHGSGFYGTTGGNTVTIYSNRNSDSFTLEVTSATSTLIKAKLPNEPITGYLTVSKDGWTSNSEDIDFPLWPILDHLSFVGDYVQFGEELTIYGENFGEEIMDNIVVFENGDADLEEGIEANPTLVSEARDWIKVNVPLGVESGSLQVEINDYRSNALAYELQPGPQIYFNDHSAYLSGTGLVVLNVDGDYFSPDLASNEVFINGVEGEILGSLGTTRLVVEFTNPDVSGNIYVKTNGYKGNDYPYDFSWLLTPNIYSLSSNYDFSPSSPITIQGINFSESTILSLGDEDGELTLSESNVSENKLTAYISSVASVGQVIQLQLRNDFYSGNVVQFTVGDTATTLTFDPDEEEPTVEDGTGTGDSDGTGETPDENPSAEPIIFPDVSDSDWFKIYVDELSSLGIVQGRMDGLYHPGDLVTRAEFLKIALLAAEKTPQISDSPFQDISGHWAEAYIDKAYALGLIDSNTNFYPDRSVSRAEAIKMLINSFEISTLDVQGDYFKDTATHWSVLYVAKAYELGLVSGYVDSATGLLYFYPDRELNRAEAAKIVAEILE